MGPRGGLDAVEKLNHLSDRNLTRHRTPRLVSILPELYQYLGGIFRRVSKVVLYMKTYVYRVYTKEWCVSIVFTIETAPLFCVYPVFMIFH
jgi:hypothetical protein